MGWPRKGDMRLYQERKDKSFLLVLVCNGTNGSGQYDVIGNAFAGPNPSLCGTGADRGYLLDRCRRVAWEDMPENWQRAFTRYMTTGGEKFDPVTKVGLNKTPT